MEFVFTREYSKVFRLVFGGNYDFDAEEEKGTITVTLTPNAERNWRGQTFGVQADLDGLGDELGYICSE